MPRRLIDISSPLMAGIKSDPPHMLPQIEYLDHHADRAGDGGVYGRPRRSVA